MKLLAPLACVFLLLDGCVTSAPDHFYVLDSSSGGARESGSNFARQVTLRVTVPSVVDRPQMVLTTAGGVEVMDHERWAAPLADLVTTTLGQDIERRRSDIVVLRRSADHPEVPLTRIAVDIDRITVRLGAEVSLEAHWRLTDIRTGKVSIGRGVFASPRAPQSYAEAALELGACLGFMADALVKEI
jgi:uncharacterized lipoprotein YmbA